MMCTSRPRRFAASACAPATASRGSICSPKESERYFALLKVEKINGEAPDVARDKILFDNLTPLYPHEKFKLECEDDPKNFSTRTLSTCWCRSAWGQRGLIVSTPARWQYDAPAKHRHRHREE